jgi:predicted anti-sigma-YlaC factor YlaD
MGKKGQMFGAWTGATLGGYFGEGVGTMIASRDGAFWTLLDTALGVQVHSGPPGRILAAVPAEAGGFILGAFLGVLVGEALSAPSVAAGLKGIVLGTKHGVSASAGGYVAYRLSESVQTTGPGNMQELAITAIGALVSVLVFDIIT